MSEDVDQLDRAGAVRDDERQGTARVVLVSVMVPAGAVPDHLANALGAPVEAWIPVAARSGAVETAIRSFSGQSGEAGNRPGTYKAPPATQWFVSPLVIEPPLG